MKRMGVLCGFCCLAVLAVLAACDAQGPVTSSDMLSVDVSGGAAVSQKNTIPDKPQTAALPDGAVVVRGEVVGGGAPCVQFRTDDGRQISLEGASHRDFAIGDRFELTGQFVAMSRCMQGPGFNVTHQDAL